MLMANSVEGRFPFLDHRVAEFAARLPDSLKLRGLTEKLILRRIAKDRVPPQVWTRTKFPYRAPIAEALIGANAAGSNFWVPYHWNRYAPTAPINEPATMKLVPGARKPRGVVIDTESSWGDGGGCDGGREKERA